MSDMCTHVLLTFRSADPDLLISSFMPALHRPRERLVSVASLSSFTRLTEAVWSMNFLVFLCFVLDEV